MLEKFKLNQFRWNILTGVGMALVNISSIMIGYPVYLGFLGYEKYGIWLMLATVLAFAQIGKIGTNEALIKLVAEEEKRKNNRAIEEYVSTTLALVTLIGIIILFFIIIFRNDIWHWLNLDAFKKYKIEWLLIGIACLSVYAFIVQTFNATLSGLNRMDLANYNMALGRIVSVASSVIFLYLGYGIESLFYGNVLNFVTIHISTLIHIKRIYQRKIFAFSRIRISRTRNILTFSVPVFGSTIIQMLFSPFNKLMLTHLGSISYVPIFEITYNGAMQIRNIIGTGLRALLPEVSRIGAERTVIAHEKLRQLYLRSLKFVSVYSLPVYFLLAVFAELFLKLWLGDKFVPIISPIFRLMLLGTYFNLVAVPAWYLFMGSGKAYICVIFSLIMCLANALYVSYHGFINGQISLYSVAVGTDIGMVAATAYILFKATLITQKR